MERCPDKRTLEMLLESEAATDAALQGHLDGCADCRHTLEMLAGGQGTWEGMTGLANPLRTEPALQELMARLKEAETPLTEDEIEGLLKVSDKPGVLGVLGSYDVLEVIGRGSMAVVFKAFEPMLNRTVALKVLSPRLINSNVPRKRFLREARAAACIRSENVIAMHAVEEVPLPYLVMQFIEGGSLQDRIEREGPLPVDDIVCIGFQTASGLAAAHKQGIIHRDIKPANLMLSNAEITTTVKITDFGLARAIDDTSVTRDRVVIGTPEYMSPEQARGEALDQRSDLFSLGSVMYAMCTGKSPFRGESAVAVLRRVSDETPTPLRSLNPNVPAWLASLIERLMAKNPADRIASADEVAKLLQGYLAHIETAAPAPTLPAAPRRNRLKARGVVLMAATLLLVAVFAALLVRSLPIADWRLAAVGLGGLFVALAMAAFSFIYWWPMERKEPNQSSTKGGQRPGSERPNGEKP